MASIAKIRLIGVTIQTGVGQAHVEFFAVGIDINSLTIAYHRLAPDIQQLHMLGFHVFG